MFSNVVIANNDIKIGGIVLHSPTKSKIREMIDRYCLKSNNQFKDFFIGRDYEMNDFYQNWIKQCDIFDCEWLIKSNPKIFSDVSIPVLIIGGQLDKQYPFAHQQELFRLIKQMRGNHKNDNVDCIWFSENGGDYNKALDEDENLIFNQYMYQYFSTLKTRENLKS